MSFWFTPASIEIHSQEITDVPCDFTNYLEGGQTIATANATLEDAESGEEYADGIVDATPDISGSIVLPRVTGLKRGHTYELTVKITTSPASGTLVGVGTIEVKR